MYKRQAEQYTITFNTDGGVFVETPISSYIYGTTATLPVPTKNGYKLSLIHIFVICGEGYTKDQQQKFINDVKRIWAGVLKHEPYRSMADRFNAVSYTHLDVYKRQR